MKLIIVESPTKAKTISRFLADGFTVESCRGHIRDLPRGKMGIDIEHNFEPQYVIPTKKRKIVNSLKKLAQKAETIYYASDEDREGEAIAWHLKYIFNDAEIRAKDKRIVFHEITEEAIKEALESPREIDINLVNAQQARRILDRLVGYELSPFLWKKIAKGLSAGRVQSPALRLIVEREEEINKFKPEEYWTITARLAAKNKKILEAKLYKLNGQVIDKLSIKYQADADKIVNDLIKAKYLVTDIQEKESKKYSPAPLTTSALQQEGYKKLGFSSKKTMMIAQQLYEGIELGEKEATGLITYMRTDSLNLAEKFLAEVAHFVPQAYGEKFLAITRYKTKSKVAQEAHEAIRPTSCLRTPEKIKSHLTNDQFKLYDLIWRRAIASQMSCAVYLNTAVDVKADQYLFRANGSVLKFNGWLAVYPDKQNEIALPTLKINDELKLKKLLPEQHFTEPPARFNDASLVKALEALGIGRPSTYAPIISTLLTRNYVNREKRALKPTEIGVMVNKLLVEHFADIVDYQFTARLEDELDQIANGMQEWLPMIKNFYDKFKSNLMTKEKEITKSAITETTDEKCPRCGKSLAVKMSRFGKFLGCSGFPDCHFTKSLPGSGDNGDYEPTPCPKCQEGKVVPRRTKKGRMFYGCNRWPACDYATWKKPGEK